MNPDFDGDKPYWSSNFKSGSHTSARNLWKDAKLCMNSLKQKRTCLFIVGHRRVKITTYGREFGISRGDNAIPRGKCGPKLVDSAAKYDEWSSSDPIILHYTPLGEEQ